MASASLEPIQDLIDNLKYLLRDANPGPFGPNSNYGSIVSDSVVPGDYPPEDDHYDGKTLICETIQNPNRPLIIALLNNAAGIIDALETLTEAMESVGVHPDLVDSTARAYRKNGMKQFVEASRKENKI